MDQSNDYQNIIFVFARDFIEPNDHDYIHQFKTNIKFKSKNVTFIGDGKSDIYFSDVQKTIKNCNGPYLLFILAHGNRIYKDPNYPQRQKDKADKLRQEIRDEDTHINQLQNENHRLEKQLRATKKIVKQLEADILKKQPRQKLHILEAAKRQQNTLIIDILNKQIDKNEQLCKKHKNVIYKAEKIIDIRYGEVNENILEKQMFVRFNNSLVTGDVFAEDIVDTVNASKYGKGSTVFFYTCFGAFIHEVAKNTSSAANFISFGLPNRVNLLSDQAHYFNSFNTKYYQQHGISTKTILIDYLATDYGSDKGAPIQSIPNATIKKLYVNPKDTAFFGKTLTRAEKQKANAKLTLLLSEDILEKTYLILSKSSHFSDIPIPYQGRAMAIGLILNKNW